MADVVPLGTRAKNSSSEFHVPRSEFQIPTVSFAPLRVSSRSKLPVPIFVSFRVIRGQKSEFWVPDPDGYIRAIRGQSAVGPNCRNLAGPEISAH
jgi:hypothetical protein